MKKTTYKLEVIEPIPLIIAVIISCILGFLFKFYATAIGILIGIVAFNISIVKIEKNLKK